MASHLPGALFKYRNHYEMVPASALILKNDGMDDVYEFLNSRDFYSGQKYLTLAARGAEEADLPWTCGYVLHTFHYHHPWTHRGYLIYKSAADELSRLFTIGQNFWHLGRKDRAVYQLGRMLHLVQDVFVPHHAAVTAFRGHGQLEEWLDDHWRFYVVEKGGHYVWEKTFARGDKVHVVNSQNPYDWVEIGSHMSFQWYEEHFLNGADAADSYPKLARKIIPNTLRYSAGFMNRFFVGLSLSK